jgi:hypothetical protein
VRQVFGAEGGAGRRALGVGGCCRGGDGCFFVDFQEGTWVEEGVYVFVYADEGRGAGEAGGEGASAADNRGCFEAFVAAGF